MCLRPYHYFKSDMPDEEGKFPGFIAGYQLKVATFNHFEKHGIKCSLSYICEGLPVPCGRCVECKKSLQVHWTGRCIAEMETCKNAYFLTLTMDDAHVHPVNKRDVQLFMKRLRKYIKCRYLFVGELGELSNRPHYHAIIFTDDQIDDLILCKRGTYPLYRSPMIESIWSDGFSTIAPAMSGNIAYTIGYLATSEKKTAFKMQSQGLGVRFFKDLKKKYILSQNNGRELTVSLPRYLKQKYDLDFEVDLETLNLRWKNKFHLSGKTEKDFRDFEEYLANSKLKV